MTSFFFKSSGSECARASENNPAFPRPIWHFWKSQRIFSSSAMIRFPMGDLHLLACCNKNWALKSKGWTKDGPTRTGVIGAGSTGNRVASWWNRQCGLTLHCMDYIKSHPTKLWSINFKTATKTTTYIAMPSRKTSRCSVHSQLEQRHEALASAIQICQLITPSTSDVVYVQSQRLEFLNQSDDLQMLKS